MRLQAVSAVNRTPISTRTSSWRKTPWVRAESNVVVNQIGLRRNLLTVLTKTGELLDERGIVIQ